MSSPAEDIEAVLEESGPDYSDFSFEVPGGGHQSDVYLVSLEHRGEKYEIVVKFEPPQIDSFEVEPKLHEYVGERTDVPMPRILVFEEEPEADVPPYFVTARLEGENLAQGFPSLEMDTRRRVMRQAGRILGDMHAEIGFEAFGWLDLWQGQIIVRDLQASWRDYFEGLIEGHVQGLEDTPFADLADRARDAIEPALEFVPEEGVPRLVHNDFRPSNMLFEPDAEQPITAVLDWQDVLAAHPEYNLAQTEFLFVDSSFTDPDVMDDLRSELYEGYGEHRDLDLAEGYEDRRPLFQLSTVLWRMAGFEAAFADASGLAQARAEAQYRQQFERLLDALPGE